MIKRLTIPILLLFFFSCSSTSTEESNSISVEVVKQIIDESNDDYFLLDVRTLEEYYGDLGHLPDAKLMPYNDIKNRIDELSDQKKKKIIAYCQTGRRSSIATTILKEHGFEVYNMTGGMKRMKQLYPDF